MAGFPKGANRRAEKASDPRPGVKVPREDIIKALTRYQGNISRAAESLGCMRLTVQRAVEADPLVRKARDDAREAFLDDLEESAEREAVQNPQATALKIFMLKTRARHRGYEQDDIKNATQDIAKAAFEFVMNKGANPAES